MKTIFKKIVLFLLLLISSLSAETNDNFPSLHVLIATAGKKSLIRMLESLQNQLTSNDYITVVFDSMDYDSVFEKTKKKLNEFNCTHKIIMENKNLGFWGHGIRNKYNVLPGDFILHADDDDIYTNDAFDIIRKTCKEKSTLYIFKIQRGYNDFITGNPIHFGNISTQSGVIPAKYNSKSYWAEYYGGDGAFYKKLATIVPNIAYLDDIIYLKGPYFY